MSTMQIDAAFKAILAAVELRAKSSGTDSEGLASLAQAMRSIGATGADSELPQAVSARVAILDNVNLKAALEATKPEELAYLATVLRTLEPVASANEFRLIRDAGTKEVQLARDQAIAVITKFVANTEQAYLDADGLRAEVRRNREAAALAEQNAKTSETNSRVSETNSKSSETAAKASQTAAGTSETNSKTSEKAAAQSAADAKTSETASKTSETNAKTSETAASTSAGNAKTAQDAAAQSRTAAKLSEDNSKASETAANDSKRAAATASENAKTSETNSKTSETNAATAAETASIAKVAAVKSAEGAELAKQAAADSATAAAASETRAAQSASTSDTLAKSAAGSAKNAADNAQTAREERLAAEAARDAAQGISDGSGLVLNTSADPVLEGEIPVFANTTGLAIRTSGVTFASFLDKPIDATRITSGTIDLSRLPQTLVVTSDPRLSDARTPLDHTHSINSVNGLSDALNGLSTSTATKLAISAYTASDVLLKLRTVAGSGSLLDSDLLDGQQGSYFLDWKNFTDVPQAFKPESHTHLVTEIVDAKGAPATFVKDTEVEAIAKRIMNAQLVGTIVQLPASGLPTGRRILKLNGASLSRTSYAELWAFAQASGNLASSQSAKTAAQFGPGDGSTTFTLPDYRGYFLRALSDGAGIDSGRSISSVQSSQNLSHGHSADTGYAGSHAHGGSTNWAGYHGHSSTSDFTGGHYHDFGGTQPLVTPGGQLPSGVQGGGSFSGGITTLSYTGYGGSHSHAINVTPGGDHSHSINTDTAGNHYHSVSVYAAGGDEARPTNLAVLYGIFF